MNQRAKEQVIHKLLTRYPDRQTHRTACATGTTGVTVKSHVHVRINKSVMKHGDVGATRRCSWKLSECRLDD